MSNTPLSITANGDPPMQGQGAGDAPSGRDSSKKPYQAPKLTMYGNLTKVTQFFPPDHHHPHRFWSRD